MLYPTVMNLGFCLVNRAGSGSRCLAWTLNTPPGSPNARSAGMSPALRAGTPKAGNMPALRPRQYEMSRLVPLLVVSLGWSAWAQIGPAPATNAAVKIAAPGFVGSRSCRECHDEILPVVVHLLPRPCHAALHARVGPDQPDRAEDGNRRGQVPVPRRHPQSGRPRTHPRGRADATPSSR